MLQNPLQSMWEAGIGSTRPRRKDSRDEIRYEI
jgi:hypothetical protein